MKNEGRPAACERRDGKGPCVGLACAGGGLEGAIYEIGVLCALEEAIAGLRFHELDVYVGVSAGGIVVSNLANGISAHTLSRAVMGQAEDPTLNLKPEVIFSPSAATLVSRLNKLPDALSESVRPYLRTPRDASLLNVLTNLGTLLPMGLFDNRRLESHLAEAFAHDGRTNSFRALDPFLRIVAANIDTAEIATFGGPDTAHVPISRAVQASTALPILYEPVEIDGNYYIDGAARRTLHASVALDQGTDLLFCVNPIVPVRNDRTTASGESGLSLADHGILSVLTQTFRMLVYSRMQAGFRSYAHLYPKADIVLIEPTPEDYRMIFSNLFSFSNRRAVGEQAYQATREHLRRYADTIQPKLKRHGFRLRHEVIDDPSRTLYGDLDAFEGDSEMFEQVRDALGRLDEVLNTMRAELDARADEEARTQDGT